MRSLRLLSQAPSSELNGAHVDVIDADTTPGGTRGRSMELVAIPIVSCRVEKAEAALVATDRG